MNFIIADPRRARPFVSVVVPAYNAERYLPDTLMSARHQTYPNFEILVVDDGSTDGTAAVVAAQAAEDARIRLVSRANGGVAEARNHGIQQARGELIAPLDADDLWHPDYLARQVDALFAAGPSAALSYAGFLVIDENGRVRGRNDLGPMPPPDDLFRSLIGQNLIGCGSAAVMRRRAVLAVGGYDASLRARGAQGCEDLKLYLALAEQSNFVRVSDHLVGYRQSSSNMSADVQSMRRSYKLVMQAIRARRSDLPARLFWRSEAFFALYLANLCGRNRRWKDEGWLRLHAILAHPLFITDPNLRRAMVRDLFHYALKLLGLKRGRSNHRDLPHIDTLFFVRDDRYQAREVLPGFGQEIPG